MPELPDVALYVEHVARRIAGRRLERVRLANPFVLRTAVPPVAAAEGRKVAGVRRVGKRIVIALEGGLFLADRALSRLLKKSWPRSIDELE